MANIRCLGTRDRKVAPGNEMSTDTRLDLPHGGVEDPRIGTATGKAIVHRAMIVAAEAAAEVRAKPGAAVNAVDAVHTTARKAVRSCWKEYHQDAEKCISPVIFPVDAFLLQILSELTQYYHVGSLEDVRVIRDRQTTEKEKTGIELKLKGIGPAKSDAFVARQCELVCFSNQNFNKYWLTDEDFAQLPPGVANPPRVVNNGDNDVAPDATPSQFILLRGLESSVTEELLAKGVAKLYKPSPGSEGHAAPQAAKKGAKVASTTGDANLGARDGSIRRVLLVRDRRSNESWKYGFAEFATVEDAQAALTRYNSFETFTISSKPVLASYIHAGVFVPVLNPTASTERFTFSPLGNPAMKLAYWDENAYVTELTVSTEDLDKTRSKSKPATTDKSQKPLKEAEKAKKRKADTGGSTSTKKLAVPTHLQFWSNRHAELHGIQRDEPKEGAPGSDNRRTTSEDGGSSSASPVPTQSYADLNRKCCYLCMRQFKTEAEVNKHERLSQLHRDNLQNEELKAKAVAKLAKKRDPAQPSGEYRDRAKERRQAFGPSTKPKEKKVEKEIEEAAPVPAMSKGAALLGKMGWSAGTGLGAEGSGMTAPITTDLYVQGVGLGAQGGKVGDAVQEAGRNTRGRYDEFLEKTKEGARERYERLSKE
ncbi:hypothetical protein FQN50_003038 [Emmonsiellopsis sp. PD_5]|nr:hypothetical protein FQN50_003038 [Emmonsiellopsis sp. PD_5]